MQYQNSSPTAILQGFDQFAKGAKRAIYELAILRAENTVLRAANYELSRRCCTKKRRLQEGGLLTLQDVQGLRA